MERLESLLLLSGHRGRGLWPQARGAKNAGEAWSYDVTIIESYWRVTKMGMTDKLLVLYAEIGKLN